MLTTCTSAKSLDTHQTRTNQNIRCSVCGKALPIAGSYDSTTAIQTEAPRPTADVAQFDHDIASIRIKSRASRAMRVVGIAVVIVAGFAILLALPLGFMSFFLLGDLIDSKEDQAVTQAKGPLTSAVQSYFLKHGKFPATLEETLNKDAIGGPFLENRDALRDPWGNRYQYDAKGPRNNGTKPDIWTVNLANGELIGNWPKVR